jgi:anti-anti-sigma factor
VQALDRQTLQGIGSTLLKVNFETVARTTLLIPEGRLDFGAAPEFQKQIEKVLAGAPAALIVDCTALDYVSSAGLRVFLRAAQAAQRDGIAFALCALQPRVREVFDLSGFSRIMTVHADRATALAHVPGPSP